MQLILRLTISRRFSSGNLIWRDSGAPISANIYKRQRAVRKVQPFVVLYAERSICPTLTPKWRKNKPTSSNSFCCQNSANTTLGRIDSDGTYFCISHCGQDDQRKQLCYFHNKIPICAQKSADATLDEKCRRWIVLSTAIVGTFLLAEAGALL